MAQRSKAYKAAKAAIGEDLYSPVEAIRLAKETNPSKTDATVEVALRLSVDPRKADQMVRGSVSLPHGTGKTARVLVFATGANADAAREAGADFVGAEATASYRFAHDWKGTLFGDVVRAENRDTGDALPRIAPARLGARLARQWRGLEGELEFYRGFAQHRVASHEGETGTPGYDMLNLTFSYALAGNPDYTVFLRGSNLLAETVWNHTSFLADRVPEPGRNLSAGIRLAF